MIDHDIQAEQAILYVLMHRPELARATGLGESDLDEGWGHPLILRHILAAADVGLPCDPVTMRAEMEATGELRKVGAGPTTGALYLAEILAAPAVTAQLGYYVDRVRHRTARRRLDEIGVGLQQAARMGDDDDALDRSAQLAAQAMIAVDESASVRAVPGLQLVRDLLADPYPTQRWLIPAVLERTDRTIVIAEEGAGKSWLSRQVGTCLSAGVHPFAPSVRIPLGRTLVVDLENPLGMVHRSFAEVVRKVGGVDAIGDRLALWHWPRGVDIRSPGGRAQLVQAIEQTGPDLVVLGPLYKLARVREHDSYELAAQEQAAVLDEIRVRYDVALWIEHHMPKSSGGRRMDPLGSSFWMRWPEFGLNLVEDGEEHPGRYNVAKFRGDREARCWPRALDRDGRRLPWAADYADEDLAELYRIADEVARGAR